MNNAPKENTSIAKKVIFYVIFVGVFVAFIGTTLSLRRDYNKFKKNLTLSFKNVEKTYLETLATSLYSEDNDQVKNILKGILSTPDFIYVQISGVDDESDEIKFKVGELRDEPGLSHTAFILMPKEERDEDEEEIEKIGQIKMFASLKGITEKMKEQVIIFVLIQSVQFFLMTLLIYYVFRKFVSKHLEKMANYAENFDLNDLDKPELFLDRKESKKSDELEKVVFSFNKMKKNLQVSHEKLKDYADNLEEKVKDATKEIEEEKDNVSNLLNNMRQAIFCVNADWNVISPVSSFAKICFEKDILGQDIFKTLFKDVDRAGESYANISSAFSVMFGSDDLQFEMVEDHLIPKIFYTPAGKEHDDKSKKTFSITYTPLWDGAGLLDRVMFNIEDVTEKEKLEKKIKEEKKSNQKNISIITQMANSDLDDIELFLTNSRNLIDETMKLAKKESNKNDGVQSMFRFLHTLKGNARAFKFESISSLTHITETQVKDIKDSDQQEFEREDVVPLIENLYVLRQELNDYGKLAKKVFRIENNYEKKLLKETHGHITDLDNLICESITNKEKQLSMNESLKIRREAFNEVKEKSISEDIILKLKRLCHSLKGCLRSNSALISVNKKVQIFENSFSILNKMNEVSLDDFSSNFIESFIDIKDQIKTTYMQSDLSRPLHLEKSEWAELIVEIYKLSIISPNKKVSNRDFDYAVKNTLTIIRKFELMYLEKIISDFSQKLHDPEHTSFEDTTYAFSEMWKYISLVNYLDFSKVKSNDERETFYGEFEKIIEISKNENENLVRSKVLELNHRLILHSVLDELSKSNIKVFDFFSEAKKWIGDLSPWGGDLIDLFLFKGDKASNLSALRVELKTARIINNLPPRILEMAKNSDPVASILSQFFIDKHYYYYLKLIDFFQLVDGFFTEKAGELGIKKVETWPVVMRNIKKLEKILELGDIEDIRKAVQRLKDIPIVPQISKFRSMVYDIALKLSKNVEFEIDGGDVSLDKESYNLLQDALVHILRNSLDHGIELPLERQELGKPAKGKIEVTCFENKKDDGIEIIVKDDGKGIDHEIIGRKAVEKGLFKEGDIKNMSKNDIIQIIFFPSFSQKDSVDELSGRGIGMDVVKENIKKLGGKIEVETHVGRGTTFKIQINPKNNN